MSNNRKPVPILMADDDADDRRTLDKAWKIAGMANSLHFVKDGEALMDFLHQRGEFLDPAMAPRPGLILLDLNMPKKDGREALREIKADPQLRQIPVVVLTTSRAEEDIYRTYDLGANSFITKPVSVNAMAEVLHLLDSYWLDLVALPATNPGD